LCFRCLGSDHQGKDCRRSQKSGIDGSHLSHHSLLHNPKQIECKSKKEQPKDENPPGTPREGVEDGKPTVSTTTCNAEPPEDYSSRTIPVWIKANGKEVKVNEILDDASNETFLNQDVAEYWESRSHLRK
jgi:hypothetical protein